MFALIIVACLISYHAFDLVKRAVKYVRSIPDRMKNFLPSPTPTQRLYYWPSWTFAFVFALVALACLWNGRPFDWTDWQQVVGWIAGWALPAEAAWHFVRHINDRIGDALVKQVFDEKTDDGEHLVALLPDEMVKQFIRDHPGIKATLILYEIDQCFDKDNKRCRTPDMNALRKKLADEYMESDKDLSVARQRTEDWLRSFRFTVKWKFNPLKREKLEVADVTSTQYAKPLKDVYKAFLFSDKQVEYIPMSVESDGKGKIRTFKNKKGEVKEMWRKNEDGQYEPVRATEGVRTHKGKAIGDVVHSVTAQRQNRLCNGNNVYLRALVEVNQFYDMSFPRYKAVSSRSVLFDPEIAGAALTSVDCKVENVLTSFVNRALEGNALSQANIGLITPGTVEVAQIASAEVMGKVFASGKAVDHMSRTYAEHALRKRGYNASIKKLMSGDGCLGLEQFKLAESMHHLDDVDVKPLKYRKYALFFAGLALSAPLIQAVAAKIPSNPAKREAKLFRPGPKTKAVRPSGKWFLPDFDQDARNNSFAPQIGMYPTYDRKSIDVAEASFRGRIMKDNGMSTVEGNETLLRATKYALAQLQPPQLDIRLDKDSMLRWIDTRPAWSEKKKAIHRAVLTTMPDVIDDAYMRNHSAMEAFIKDEYYSNSEFAGMHTSLDGKLKAPRNICDRQKEFKIVAGTVLQAVNDWFFEHDFCIKHVPHQKRGQYIADRFAGKGRCITTDHSAFESSANAVNQLLCEQLFYRKMLPRELWFVCDVICQPNIIKNKSTGAAILTDTIRYSGDITTSVGNSILNYCSALAGHYLSGGNITLPELSEVERRYITELRSNYGAGSPRPLKALGDPYVTEMESFEETFANLTRGFTPRPNDLTVLVEGDDAIIAAPSLAEPEAYQKHMCCMGLAVTIEGSSDASKAGFCSIYWQETADGIRTYTDPIDNLVNSLWSTRRPTKDLPARELLKSKWMAVCNQFPSCPCVWNLVQDMTAQYVPDSFYLREVLNAQGKKYTTAGEYLRVECSPVPEPTDADRAMFHELFGLSPDGQRELEAKGMEGMFEMIRFCRATGRLQDMFVNASESVLYIQEP